MWLRELLDLPGLELQDRALSCRLRLVEEDVLGLTDAKETTLMWSQRVYRD